MMILFYLFILFIIVLVVFDLSNWYYCPNCQKWYRVNGYEIKVYHLDDNKTVILHHGEKHFHTTGYHGLWSKPLK